MRALCTEGGDEDDGQEPGDYRVRCPTAPIGFSGEAPGEDKAAERQGSNGHEGEDELDLAVEKFIGRIFCLRSCSQCVGEQLRAGRLPLLFDGECGLLVPDMPGRNQPKSIRSSIVPATYSPHIRMLFRYVTIQIDSL